MKSKKRNLIGLVLSSSALVISAITFGAFKHNTNEAAEPVAIDTSDSKYNPIFYPASYSTSFEDEPYFENQKATTFDLMNFANTPKSYRGDSVKVAVIDSGINYAHEDFGTINSNSRTIDNSSGSWLYYPYSSYQTKINDTLGHGTNVASVIASQINSLGCAGIAPNVDLYVYKVTNTSNGYEWDAIINALQYCIDNKIDVVNMSFQAYEHAVSYGSSSLGASTGCSTVLSSKLTECYNKGITLVGAAGNYNTNEPSYPANNNHVISVGSLADGSTTSKAGFSNTYGIDLVAPGYVYVADKGSTNAYKKTQGTSFSAPIVTAAIALYKQRHSTATPAEIETALYASCDKISGNPSWSGNGRLNIDRFLGVDAYSPSKIEITNVPDKTLELQVGDTFQLNYKITPATYTDGVEFTTYDTGAISVSNSGLITALEEGEDAVSISCIGYGDIYDEIEVTIVPKSGGEQSDITVIADSYSTNVENGDEFVWGTSNSNCIASISGDWGNLSGTSDDFIVFTAETTTGGFYLKTSDSYLYSSAAKKISLSSSNKTVLSINSSNGSITGKNGSTNVGTYVVNGNVRPYTSNISSYTLTYLYKVTHSSGSDTKTLSRIDVTSNNRSFTVGDTFKKESVTAYFTDSTHLNVSDSAVFTIPDLSSKGSKTVSVSYTYDDVTKSTSYTINVYDPIQPDDYGTYYSTINENSATLLADLRTLNLSKRTSTVGYSSMGTTPSGMYKYTDYDPTTVQYDAKGQPYGTKILSFYSGKSCTSWNREHVWPNSRGGGSGGAAGSPYPDADIFMPRPTITEENSDRGNSKYVEGIAHSSNGWDPVTAFSKTLGVYQGIRGECARIIFYCLTVNSKLVLDDTATGGTLGVTMGKLSDLLKWNLENPVNDREIRRQSGGQYLQGNRNAFVDHPEYACKIWGNYNDATRQICGQAEKTLTSISLSGTYPTEFTVGDIFSYTGLTVTAHYSDNSYKIVTPTNVSMPNMSSAESKTITVTYTEDGTTKTATYNITVSSGSVTPDPVKHTTALSFDKNTATINVGETVTLVATKTPADSVDAVTWSTSDSTIATVANGIVTGVKAGTATITASSNGINATCLVTIQSSQTSADITITDSSLKSSYQTSGANLTITVSDNNFTAYNVANYSNGIQFKGGSGYLSNNTALSIDSIQLVTKSGKTFSGKLYWGDTEAPSSNSTNVSEGNTYSNPGSYQYFKLLTGSSAGYLDKIIIHLKQSGPKVTNVVLDKSTLDFDLYNNYFAKTLVATVTADDGADKTVTWTSSNDSIATVSNGIVTPLAVGTATITAKAGDETATCTVTVTDSTPVSVNGVTLNIPSLSVSVGTSQTLTATVSPTNATNKNVTWSSNNSSIASVDNGVVTGVGIGSTTITVTTVDGDYTATCSVTVTAAPVITYKLEASKTVLPFGSGTNHTESVSLTIYKYSDNVKGDVAKTDSVDIDTTVLGKQTVSLSYNSQNYSTDIVVTNNESSEFVGVTKQGSSAIDKLTASDFKATGTTYTAFSDVSKNNGAIYAGASAKDNSGNIQLRSKSSDSGIFQTTSGGKVTSISVVVGSGSNTLSIYGKNTAYSSVGDLYDGTKQGTLIGEISETGTVNFAADKQYDYVGIRSSNGAIYLTSISFTYGTAGETYNATPLEQAKAWAEYFIAETRTEDTCLASNDSDKLSGLNAKWSNLANEYNWMIGASKDAFCDEKATGVIAEAMKHYQFITTKFTSLTKFVTDSYNAAPKVVQQPGLLTSKIEPAAVIAGSVAMVGCLAICGCFFYKKRKKI